MTENEKTIKQAIRCVVGACDETCYHWSSGVCHGYEEVAKGLEKALEEIKQYRAIGTIEEFKALKEKSVAKKPLHQGFVFACPCCNDKATIGSVFLRPNQKYCIDCGTEFDWQ